jgi:hypothetical protein
MKRTASLRSLDSEYEPMKARLSALPDGPAHHFALMAAADLTELAAYRAVQSGLWVEIGHMIVPAAELQRIARAYGDVA